MRSTQAMKAYHQADREAAAESESPHEMISVLFDELIRRMEAFKANMLDDSKEKLKTVANIMVDPFLCCMRYR